MPKFKIYYYENYSAETCHEVEAENEVQAEAMANELQANHTTPVEDINFIDWEWARTEQIKDCMYCDEGDKKPSEHFCCDNCGVGMCNECYDNQREHDGHFHRPYESEEWDDIRLPDYVCENCISEYSYKK